MEEMHHEVELPEVVLLAARGPTNQAEKRKATECVEPSWSRLLPRW
jgi:hypothetical protein